MKNFFLLLILFSVNSFTQTYIIPDQLSWGYALPAQVISFAGVNYSIIGYNTAAQYLIVKENSQTQTKVYTGLPKKFNGGSHILILETIMGASEGLVSFGKKTSVSYVNYEQKNTWSNNKLTIDLQATLNDPGGLSFNETTPDFYDPNSVGATDWYQSFSIPSSRVMKIKFKIPDGILPGNKKFSMTLRTNSTNSLDCGAIWSEITLNIPDLTEVTTQAVSTEPDFALYQNFPNPFNPNTKIAFSLPKQSNVTLTICNQLGEEIATLAKGNMEEGRHTVEWNASGIPSGIYFYKISAGQYTVTKKMLLIK